MKRTKKISNYDGSDTTDTDAADTDATDTDATDTDATDTDATDTDATDTDATDTDTTDTDATDTDATDTDTTDTDTTDTDTGIVTECEKLVFTDAESYENEIYSSIYIEETDEFPFYLSITFYDYFMNEDNEPDFAAKTDIIDLKGETVTLGEGANTNLATCTECVLLYSDPNEEGNYTKAYLAKSGTLFFEDVEAGTVNSKGNGSFLLFEVTIDNNDISTYVEGGKCYEVSPFEWNTMEDTPVDPTEEECLTLSLEEMFMETMASDDGESTSYFAYLVGDETHEYRSYIEMNFYDSMSESGFKTDLYDLVDTYISFDDTDFNNCETCLKLNYTVYNEADEYENTFTYYPVEGYITFSNAVEGTMLSAGYGEDIKFVEVDTDPETDQLVPMEGGKCFILPSLEWDFVTEEPECSTNEDCGAGEICVDGACIPFD